jgi:lysozyme
MDMTVPTVVPEKIDRELHVSDTGIAALMKREGFKTKPYWDVNGWSIGFGDHAFHGVPLGRDHANPPKVEISEKEAKEMLRARLASHYEPLIKRKLTKPVTQDQFDALVSVAYNSEAAGRRLAGRLDSGETLTEADFRASGTVHGQPVDALQQRRAAEYAQFVSAPSPGRNATPMNALTTATRATSAPVVVAPNVTTISQNGGGGVPMIMPQPIQPRNPDNTIRAIISTNNF